MRLITVTNSDGVTLSLSDQGFMGWFMLADCDGLYKIDGNIASQENSMTDGSVYLGTTQRARTITLTLYDGVNGDHEAARRIIYNVFPLRKQGVLRYQENGDPREIGYYVENIEADGTRAARMHTITLTCPDPAFTDTQDTRADAEATSGAFEWVHEFQSAGEEFGTMESGAITVLNETGIENIGFTMVFTATGSVLNPSISCEETGESMTIGEGTVGSGTEFSMAEDDVLVITTYPGNMHAVVTRAATGISTDVTNLMTFESEFLRINFGTNTFAVSADSGATDMTATLYYRKKYPAV